MPTKSRDNMLSKKDWKILIWGGIIAVAFPSIWDAIKGYPFLTTIKKGYSFFSEILTYKVPIWVSILIVIIFFVLWILVQIIKDNRGEISGQSSDPFDFKNWKRHKFKNWEWTWDYKFTSRGWYVERLRAFCPKCGTTMIFNEKPYWPNFHCPNCNFRAVEHQAEQIGEIEALIHDAIDQKKYKSMIDKI